MLELCILYVPAMPTSTLLFFLFIHSDLRPVKVQVNE